MSTPSSSSGIVKHALQYTLGGGAGLFASMARVAITARVLSPRDAGVWLGLQLVLGYGSQAHAGVLFGLYRNVPILRACGDVEAAQREKRSSLGFTLLAFVLATPIMLVVGRRLIQSARLYQLLAVVALVGLSLWRSFLVTVFRAESRFFELSVQSALGALVSLGSLLFVVWWGLDGVLLSTLTQVVFEIGFLLYKERIDRPALDWRVIRGQLEVGVVTLLIGVGVLVMTTIDRTVMLQRFGAISAGKYYIGANVLTLLPAVAGIPASVITPRLFEGVGRGEDIEPLIAQPMRLGGPFFAFLVLAASLALRPVVSVFWPQLTEGVDAAQAALYGAYPLVMAGLVTNVFYAKNRQGPQVLVLLGCSVLSYGLSQLGANATHTITGVAYGACAGLYVYLLVATLAAFWILGRPGKGVGLLVWTLLPIIFARLVDSLTDWSLVSLRFSSWARVGLSELLAVLLFAPYGWYVYRSVRLRVTS